MRRSLLAAMLLCLVASGCDRVKDQAADASGPAVAGKVELLEGDVRFIDRERRTRRPAAGDAIYEGESIATGAASEVHLRMEDSGYIAVRPSTQLTIVNFRAEGDDDDRSLLSLVEGSFRSVTGWIAKSRTERVVIQTPTATIGIRGTEHEPLVIPEGSPLGEPGTYDRVLTGETEIRGKEGTVRVRPNQAGFVPRRGDQRPRVLERVPDAFRPAPHDARFSGLHGRVQQQVDQQRVERRREVEERRKLREEAKRAGGPIKDGKDVQDKKRGKADEGPGKADKEDRKKQEDQRKDDDKGKEKAGKAGAKDQKKADEKDRDKGKDKSAKGPAKDERKAGEKDREKGKDKAFKDAGKERLKEQPARREDKQPAAAAERREKSQPPNGQQRKADERKQDREDKRKKEARKQDKEDKRKAERPERGKKE